jgi:hypothetical protein
LYLISGWSPHSCHKITPSINSEPLAVACCVPHLRQESRPDFSNISFADLLGTDVSGGLPKNNSFSFTHAAIRPLTQPLIHSRSHSFTHAATHSLTQVQKSWPARSCWWRELRRGDCLCGTWAPQHAHEATSRWHGDRQHGGVSDTLIGITPDSNNPRKSVRSVLQLLRTQPPGECNQGQSEELAGSLGTCIDLPRVASAPAGCSVPAGPIGATSPDLSAIQEIWTGTTFGS